MTCVYIFSNICNAHEFLIKIIIILSLILKKHMHLNCIKRKSHTFRSTHKGSHMNNQSRKNKKYKKKKSTCSSNYYPNSQYNSNFQFKLYPIQMN